MDGSVTYWIVPISLWIASWTMPRKWARRTPPATARGGALSPRRLMTVSTWRARSFAAASRMPRLVLSPDWDRFETEAARAATSDWVIVGAYTVRMRSVGSESDQWRSTAFRSGRASLRPSTVWVAIWSASSAIL